MSAKKKSVGQTAALKRLLAAIRKYSGWILLSVFLAAGSVALTLYVPILIGEAIDCIVEPDRVDFEAIAVLLVRVAILVGATALMQWI